MTKVKKHSRPRICRHCNRKFQESALNCHIARMHKDATRQNRERRRDNSPQAMTMRLDNDEFIDDGGFLGDNDGSFLDSDATAFQSISVADLASGEDVGTIENIDGQDIILIEEGQSSNTSALKHIAHPSAGTLEG